MKKNMPDVTVIPPADDCGLFFLVAPVCCDSFNPSARPKCTAQHFIYHKLDEALGPFVIPAKPRHRTGQ